MNNSKIIALVSDVFSKEGALVQAGGRYNVQQAQFADYIIKALLRAKSLGFFEAGTGIGKSIAYLIPSLIVLASNENCKPIVISTYTRSLQRQLIDKDIKLASKALDKLGLKVPAYAFRMGRQAFFSPSRLESHLNDISKGHLNKEQKELMAFCNASCVSGSGMWMDYINEVGLLPDGVSVDDLCLLDYMEPDNLAYMKHLELAKDARLLITNHATVLNKHVLKENSFYALICDEAHEIESACKELSTHKSLLSSISSAICNIAPSSKKAKEASILANDLADRLVNYDKTHKSNHNLLSDLNSKKLINDISPDVAKLNAISQSLLSEFINDLDGVANQKEALKIDRLSRHVETLSSFDIAEIGYRRRAVGYSKQYRRPSIASVSLNAGGLFNYRVQQITKRCLMVSATMSNANTKNLSFSHIATALNLGTDNITDECSIEPVNFGKMHFVVVPNGKSPIEIVNDEVEFSELWVRNTANMIDYATKSGKTLVLTPSFKESKLISQKLECEHLFQDRNNSLMQLEPIFIKGDELALLSSGAWNGLSLRNEQGGQLIKNLVITRVPFVPVDKEWAFLQKEYLLSKGYSEKAISAIQWTNQQYHTVIKLKQGIGRGCRAPDDEITVYFADPRMPDPKRPTGLIAAIPNRFLSNYFDAEVFSFDNGEPETQEPFYFF